MSSVVGGYLLWNRVPKVTKLNGTESVVAGTVVSEDVIRFNVWNPKIISMLRKRPRRLDLIQTGMCSFVGM